MSTDLELTSVPGDAQAIIDVATQAAIPTVLDEGRFHAFAVPAGGAVEIIDLEAYLDEYRDRPRRKKGSYTAHDADGFVRYLGKHGLPETEVWADVTAARVVAVINAHDTTEAAGYGDHRLTYAVLPTDAWRAWVANDGKLLAQSDFAEHIEDRSGDIVRPTAAEMLELAQTFQATIGVRFESSKLLSSGERQLEYRETVDAKAGRAGAFDIPKDFELGLIPFEGADRYKVTARFRYRITDGALRIGYRLERPSDVQREAFLGVVSAISAGIDAQVFRGVSA